MTAVYLSSWSAVTLEAARRWNWDAKPLCLLVSFAQIDSWKSARPYFRPRRKMLDSGAFSAQRVGAVIDVDELIAEANRDEWDEAVSLDAIGDATQSRSNAEYMLAQGCSKAMPVFHFGEPWEYLDEYASRWPKVGLGGMVGLRVRELLPWVEQCFARAWPKKLHSFGRVQDDLLARFPFHSADASNWLDASRYGAWLVKGRGRERVVNIPGMRGTDQTVHGVTTYMESMWQRERQLVSRWGATLARLEA